jgi:cytochrome c oxidase cbb3-type subunit 2
MADNDKSQDPKAAGTDLPEPPRLNWVLRNHAKIERNAFLLLVFSFIVVAIGGIVQIVPLFYLDNTIEEVDGMRPYSPLELAGRDI